MWSAPIGIINHSDEVTCSLRLFRFEFDLLNREPNLHTTRESPWWVVWEKRGETNLRWWIRQRSRLNCMQLVALRLAASSSTVQLLRLRSSRLFKSQKTWSFVSTAVLSHFLTPDDSSKKHFNAKRFQQVLDDSRTHAASPQRWQRVRNESSMHNNSVRVIKKQHSGRLNLWLFAQASLEVNWPILASTLWCNGKKCWALWRGTLHLEGRLGWLRRFPCHCNNACKTKTEIFVPITTFVLHCLQRDAHFTSISSNAIHFGTITDNDRNLGSQLAREIRLISQIDCLMATLRHYEWILTLDFVYRCHEEDHIKELKAERRNQRMFCVRDKWWSINSN